MSQSTDVSHKHFPILSARKILNASIDKLWINLKGEFYLRFDDGVDVLTNCRETLVTHYIWEIHRSYPKTPLLSRHHVASIIKPKRWNANSHIDVLNEVFWDAVDAYAKTYAEKVQFTGWLSKLTYEIANEMYNKLSYKLGDYVIGVDVLDCIQIARHPKVMAARKLLNKNPATIQALNQAIASSVRTEDDLKDNPLSKVMQAGLVRENQAVQVLGVRGYMTDIDNVQFSEPILRGFLEGIVSLADSMMESRSASISLLNSGTQLETSEYFSRRQQLICMTLRNLHSGDCGSDKHLITTILPAGKRNGKYFSSDLNTWAGMNYLDEATGKYVALKRSDKHLEGKSLKFRSIIAGCSHHDTYGVCEVCFGQLSESVPLNTNLGHLCCVTLTAKLGQDILSTKHFLASANISGIVLPEADRKFLYVQPGRNFYYLSSALKDKRVRLFFTASELPRISDISQVKDVYNLNEIHISQINKIRFVVGDEDGAEVTPVSVSNSGTASSLTHPFLAFMKLKGMVLNRHDQYEISMDGWDWNEPILTVPMRQSSTSDVQGAIARLLESTKEKTESRAERTNPMDVFMEFVTLVNETLSVNVSVLQGIFYSSMVVSTGAKDYSLPKSFTPSGLGTRGQLLSERSTSTTMAFQHHREELTDPVNYINANRLDSPTDGILMPQEVFLSRPTIL